MTYTSGSLIEATDYNGFVSTTSNANVNDVWATGSTDKGWGQTALGTVSVGGTVTATSWASLVNTITSMANQTNTSITSRTAPTTGTLISVLSAVNTDLSNINTNRGNAAAIGTISNSWTGTIAKTSGTGSGGSAWTITFTSTVTFPSADQARYFWNAGGLVRIDMSKTSTGTDRDDDWNTFIGNQGVFYISGRVNSAAQTIAGTSYTGFTRSGGSGTPGTNLTTYGWYVLTTTNTTVWQLNDSTSPYTNNYVRIQLSKNAGGTNLYITTTWYDNGTGTAASAQISGGTDTTSPFGSFGTAPVVLVRFYPPSTSYLTNSWGTPTVTGNSVV